MYLGSTLGYSSCNEHSQTHVFLSVLSPVTVEEYKLLQKLNQMTIAKYSDMSALATRLNEVSQRLNDKCEWMHVVTHTVAMALASFSSFLGYYSQHKCSRPGKTTEESFKVFRFVVAGLHAGGRPGNPSLNLGRFTLQQIVVKHTALSSQ